jgi:hypothetical protein
MPSITVPTAVMVAATVGGSLIQGSAAKSAAKTQANAATQAAQMQWDMFQQMQGNLSPYMVTGQNALNNLSMLTGNAPSASPQIAQLTQQLNAAKAALAALPAETATTGARAGAGGIIGGVANALTGGAPAGTGGSANLGLVQSPVGGTTNQPYAAAGGGQLPGDKAGLESLISNLQGQINQAQYSSTPGNPLTAPLTRPFQPTMAELENTPGYQFTLNQGLKAAQNAATSMGLGQSGPAIAGAADYATGLASTTYQQQFQNYWANNMNLFSMLMNQAQLGQASAAGVGAAGLGTAQAAGNALMGGANALAAGRVGAANAASGGLSGLGNLAMFYGMQNNSLFGSPSAPAPATYSGGNWNSGPGGFPMPDTGGF